jgi:hypothetical protein
MGGTCREHEEIRNAYKSLVGKPEENKTIGRPRCKWKNNKVNHREMVF